MTTIDLNCDMGESYGAWKMGNDAAVMPWVSSINVACGFHAGDPHTMKTTLAEAAKAGVAVGAHIGLPDLMGFGRRTLAISPDELYALSVVQLGSLGAMATACGLAVTHLKPHGALYHMLEVNDALAVAMVEAIKDVEASLKVVGFAGGRLCRLAQEAGLAVRHEAFADRRYGADGKLLSRKKDGAVIASIDEAVAQAVSIVTQGQVVSGDGIPLTVSADTLCVHGDRADAAEFAKALYQGLTDVCVEVTA